MKRKIASLFLALCMIITLLPTTALAVDLGGFSVDVKSGNTPVYADGVLTIASPGEYTIGMKAGVTTTTDRIVVAAGDNAVTLNLNGVNIKVPNIGTNESTSALTVISGKVTLNLLAKSTLVGGDSINDGGNGIQGNFILSGAGGLEAVGSDSLHDGGDGVQGDVTLSGTATLLATGGSSVQGGNRGNGVQGNVTASDQAAVTADGKIGIDGTVSILGNAALTASGNDQAVSGTITSATYAIQGGSDGTNYPDTVTSGTTSDKTYIKIAPPAYDVWVGGVQVTGANKGGVTGPGITGKVTYDPDTATLTLDGATITAAYADGNGDWYNIYAKKTLTILVNGTNTITGVPVVSTYRESCGIRSSQALTIGGTGALTATGGAAAANTNSCGISAAGDLRIQDTVTIIAATAPGAGNNCGIISSQGNLIISGGSVTASGSKYAMMGHESFISKTAPVLENGVAVLTASTKLDGTDPVAYQAGDIKSYQYLKVRMRPTAVEYAAAAPAARAGTDYDVNTDAQTLVIKTAKGAAYFSANGNTYRNYAITLANDMDVSAFLWSPVGTPWSAFIGSFDGGGHSIAGLTVVSGNVYIGMFGNTSMATIKNLCIASGSITGSTGGSDFYIGSLAGYASKTTIANCCNHASVTGNNTGTTSSDRAYAGGLVGFTYSSTIQNCFNTGAATSTCPGDGTYTGGIVGMQNGGKLDNCYNIGAVSAIGATENYAGGIVGELMNDTKTVDCYYLSSVCVKGISPNSDNSQTVTGCGTFGTDGTLTAGTAAQFSAQQVLTGTTLLGTLNDWVKAQTDTKYYIWKADGSSPVNGGYPLLDGPAVVHSHCLCGGELTVGDHTDHTTKLTYTAIPESFTGGPLEGNIYLDRDVTLDSPITVENGKTLNLCLNGYKLDAAGSGRVITVTTVTGTLNLCDCNGSDSTHYGMWNDENTEYTITDNGDSDTDIIKGGIVTGGLMPHGAAAGIYNAGTFNLYGGNIVGNRAGDGASSDENAKTGYGGGIYMNSTDGVLNLYGGTISGNYAGGYSGIAGAGISVVDGTFTMYGGTITGNRGNGSGGGIQSNVALNLYGGSIRGNTVTEYGGGVYVTATVKVKGNLTISGNHSGTADDNICIANYGYGDQSVRVTGPLTGGPIGVMMFAKPNDKHPAVLVAKADSNYNQGKLTDSDTEKFVSDKAAYQIYRDNGTVKLQVYVEGSKIIAGGNQNWISTSGKDLTVTSNADLADFQRVEVGKAGESVKTLTENTDYTKQSGSAIITLKNSYLKTLAPGTYILNIVSTTGTASTTFTVVSGGPATNGPATGDTSNILCWTALLFLSGGVIAAFGIAKKRKQVRNKD